MKYPDVSPFFWEDSNLRAENDKLKKINAALFQACRALLNEFNSRTALIETCDMTDDELKAVELCEQAIALAKEEED